MRELIQGVLDEVNAHYARVEQIKRFVILDHDLSQETGELTPDAEGQAQRGQRQVRRGVRAPVRRVRRLPAATLALLALVFPAAAHAAGLAATQRALARQMARAGGTSSALVVDLDTGRRLFARRAWIGRLPASVEKLYTSSTALLRFGPSATLNTSVLATGTPDADGVLTGDLYLRGGGDPTFSDSEQAAMAQTLFDQGLRRVTGRVFGDESFLDSFRGPPSTGLATSIDVGPLSGLAFDHGFNGRHFQSQPALFAAQRFRTWLKRAGITVVHRTRTGITPAGSPSLLQWPSPPMAEVIRRMNQPSDNYMAETLIKTLGATFGSGGSTAAGAAVVRDTVRRLGVRPRLYDGSGLSRRDRTSPNQVVDLLRAMRGAAAPSRCLRRVAAGRRAVRHALRPHAAHGREAGAARPRPGRCTTSRTSPATARPSPASGSPSPS